MPSARPRSVVHRTGTELEVGLVGLGGIGYKHSRVARRLGATLVGGVDVSEDARRAYAEEFDVPSFETFDELLSLGVDAIVVTTPNRFHEEYAVEALESGVSVLCEKPLAHTVESAERIVDAAERSNAACMVGFNNRFNPPVREIVDARDAGRFGEISHVDAKWLRRRGVPGRGTWFTRKELAGGGALIDLGVHVIDLGLHLLGDPAVREVSGVTRTHFDRPAADEAPPSDVEDGVTALVRCEDGKSISVDVAWATNRPDCDEVVVTGPNAGAAFNLGSPGVTFYDADPEDPDGATRVTTVQTDGYEGYLKEHRRFYEAVERGEPPERNSPEQGLLVQRIVDAVYRSSAEGRTVLLDEPAAIDACTAGASPVWSELR